VDTRLLLRGSSIVSRAFGAARDALLAAYASPGTRGRVFSFHRGMDHTGAVLGPLLATGFLLLFPGSYRTLFALTIIPGAIAVGLVLLVREPAERPPAGPAAGGPSNGRRSRASCRSPSSRWGIPPMRFCCG
jgi:MFS family permease